MATPQNSSANIALAHEVASIPSRAEVVRRLEAVGLSAVHYAWLDNVRLFWECFSCRVKRH